MYKKITADFEVVTPMFIGDADKNAESIRPTSVKGALRYWWRALTWENVRSSSDNEQQALEKLQQQEIVLFGGAANSKSNVQGRGKVSLRIRDQNVTQSNWREAKGQGLSYLLGIGLYSPPNKTEREQGIRDNIIRNSLSPGSTFTIDMVTRNVSEAEMTQLVNTLKLFGLVGGLGARNRKGFGSLQILKLTSEDQVWSAPMSVGEYVDELSQIFANYRSQQLAPFTALSGLVDSIVSVEGRDWVSCLDIIGTTQQMYRSYGMSRGGSPHRVGRENALQLFNNDHDIMFNFLADGSISEHPKRLVFGLPHNYFFSSIDRRATHKANVSGAGDSPRRASPLFIHVHKFPDGTYAAIQTLIPATFLPDNAKISYTRLGGGRNHTQNERIDDKHVQWHVIKDYLWQDKFQSHNQTSYPGFINRIVIAKGGAL